MVEIVFENPPEYVPVVTTDAFDIRKNGDREEIIAQLVLYPGCWAIVSRHASRNRAAQVSYVLRARHPELYEFRVTKKDTGEGVVYGRYVGPDVSMDGVADAD